MSNSPTIHILPDAFHAIVWDATMRLGTRSCETVPHYFAQTRRYKACYVLPHDPLRRIYHQRGIYVTRSNAHAAREQWTQLNQLHDKQTQPQPNQINA